MMMTRAMLTWKMSKLPWTLKKVKLNQTTQSKKEMKPPKLQHLIRKRRTRMPLASMLNISSANLSFRRIFLLRSHLLSQLSSRNFFCSQLSKTSLSAFSSATFQVSRDVVWSPHLSLVPSLTCSSRVSISKYLKATLTNSNLRESKRIILTSLRIGMVSKHAVLT